MAQDWQKQQGEDVEARHSMSFRVHAVLMDILGNFCNELSSHFWVGSLKY